MELLVWVVRGEEEPGSGSLEVDCDPLIFFLLEIVLLPCSSLAMLQFSSGMFLAMLGVRGAHSQYSHPLLVT